MRQHQWPGLLGIFVISELVVGAIAFTPPGLAQIRPDDSLGSERSVLTPNVQTRRGRTDRIDGGAIRGSNLFHSFSDFNVNRGQRVHFANPTGIDLIVGRVTGEFRSDINGTLGVLGNADLFLINPNGIVFGPEAQLDIRGSFLASTSDRIVFDNGYAFSATNPDTPPLVTMTFAPGLNHWLPSRGAIATEGMLAVGQDLSLVGQDLQLQGQLQAGGDVNLLANTLTIRDSNTVPFIASAGDQLLLQGTQVLDIFALNHPESGLFSGGNLVLRSNQPVIGDARFTAGGNFWVEQLDGSLGSVISPKDPVFEVSGDFSLDSFTGASLQILAGGSVTIPGEIIIEAAGGPFNDSTVVLSNGTSVTVSGTTEPTLDIRAGTTDFFGTPSNNGTPSSANITIGSIITDGGLVLLTNQFQPNPSLSGDISVGSITTFNPTQGGTVILDSRGGISTGFIFTSGTSEVTIDPTGITGNAGDITLLAGGDIFLPYFSALISSGVTGGEITLQSDTAIIQEDAPFLTPATELSLIQTENLEGRGGDITLTAPLISIGGNVVNYLSGSGRGGDLIIEADTLTANQATLITDTLGAGNSGNVRVDAREISLNYTLLGTLASSSDGGNAGNLRITTDSLVGTQGAQIGSFVTFPGLPEEAPPYIGNAGNVTVIASDSISLSGFQPLEAEEVESLITSTIFSSTEFNTIGNSGNVRIVTGTLLLSEGGTLRTNVYGQGNAGQISVLARDSITIDGVAYVDLPGIQDLFQEALPSAIASELFTSAGGQAGDIFISTPTLTLTDGGTITASTGGDGDAGDIVIDASESVSLDGFTPFTQLGLADDRRSEIGVITFPFSSDQAQAGTITINTPSLSITDNARIFARAQGAGDAGDLIFNIRDSILLDGDSGILADTTPGSTGDGGDIQIRDPAVIEIRDGASIAVNSEGSGIGGSIRIQSGVLVLDNGTISAETASNTGGNITVQADEAIALSDTSRISTSAGTAQGAGDGGNIRLNTRFLVAAPESNNDITANAFEGQGGRVEITAEGIFGLTVRSREELEALLGTSDPTELDPANLPTSDITAISQVNPNLNGVVIIRTPDVDPSRGALPLPAEVVDASRLIAQGCSATGDIAQSQGSLIVTGRGGLPPNPGGPLNSNTPLIGWDSFDSTNGSADSSPASEPVAIAPPSSAPPLVEVQSLVRRTDGQVILAAADSGGMAPSWPAPGVCPISTLEDNGGSDAAQP